MRMIDADELISSIVNRQAKIPDILPYRDFKAWLDGYTACQHDILDIVEDAPTIGGWISVKDRMPEDETEVIIIVQHKIGWYRAFAWHDAYGWHSVAEEFCDGDSDLVTHWCELPEPPEEVSGDA